MKVGDYVRTDYGLIGKTFEKYKGVSGSIIYKIDKSTNEDFDYTNVFYWEIIKSSSNIIDLIEVGDYVNGEYITYVNKKDKYVDVGYDDAILYLKDFKSIVTKEQFEAIKYEL